MIALEVNVVDRITPHLAKVEGGLRNVNALVGRAGVNAFRSHFDALEKSHKPHAGAPTHFWSQARRSTQFQVVPDGVVISVNQIGVAQRFHGGTLRPVNAQWLAIPAADFAYGKRPREFSNLRFVPLTKKGSSDQLAALVTGTGGAAVDRKVKGASEPVRRNVKGSEKGQVAFWLKKSVTQEGNPDVLPTEGAITDAIDTAMENYLALLNQRSGSSASRDAGRTL